MNGDYTKKMEKQGERTIKKVMLEVKLSNGQTGKLRQTHEETYKKTHTFPQGMSLQLHG